MTDEKWFQVFDRTSEKFHWFFSMYFKPIVWDLLVYHRKRNDKAGMISVMNTAWYQLPDSKFNIIENPKGWHEFLVLLEEA